MKELILASTSPRRQEILRKLEIPFRVIKPECDETYPPDIDIKSIPEYLAEKKVKSVLENQVSKNEFILGSDTIVLSGNCILGKPKNREEALSFLKKLQGNEHSVISGVAVFDPNTQKIITTRSETKVFFTEATDKEINWYLDTDEWKDAAGGYKIQEKGAVFVKKIEGNYSNVVGLPIFEVYDILKRHGFMSEEFPL